MKIQTYQPKENEKCPSCNWGHSALYRLKGEPLKVANCGNCFVEFLISRKASIEIV